MTPLTRDQIGLAKSVDLLSLVSDDTDLQHLTQREFAGPCPFCGGTDRFHLQSDLGRWFCRQCTGEPGDAGWQDAIDYVQRRNGLNFREAVAHLNGGTLVVSTIVHAPLAGHAPPAGRTPLTLKRKRPNWRTAAWQENAWHLVRCAQRRLNSVEGEAGQSYLLGRSILPTTWQTWGLGFSTEVWHPLRRQRLPAILLPWQQENRLSAVQYRFIESDLDKSERFSQRRGGERLLFGMQTLTGGKTLLLVEGELNALSLWQVTSGGSEGRNPKVDVLSWGPQGNILRAPVLKQIVDLASRYQKLVLWSDEADMARQAVSHLQASGLPSTIAAHAIWSPQGLDANDLLQRDLLTAYWEVASNSPGVAQLP